MFQIKNWGITIALGVMMFTCQPASAVIIINEFLADPPSGVAGDANQDGVTSSSRDEFVELLNIGDQEIDISSWILRDGISARHVFEANTIVEPLKFIVVFGGGTPNLPGVNWQISSSGSLSLNNSGDTISLLDTSDALMDQVVYGSEAGNNQSLTRFPEGEASAFTLHAALLESQNTSFSPGASLTGEPLELSTNTSTPTVPEPATWLYVMFGMLGFVIQRKLSFA